MRFLTLAPDDSHCLGALLAHATNAGEAGRLGKGTRLTQAHLDALAQAGKAQIVVAVLDSDDMDEDMAAAELAAAIAGGSPTLTVHPAATGRVNIFAARAGLLTLNEASINAFNAVDPSLTIATLGANARVDVGQMVATVKVIPFAVARDRVAAARSILGEGDFQIAPFVGGTTCALLQTELATTKPTVLEKTAKLTRQRLADIGVDMCQDLRCAHETTALAALLGTQAPDCDLVVVFGASAVSDSDDIVPAAIRRAGGQVQRVGMPVDPGNLLVLGTIGQTTVIGAPGCARSAKRNGFDWVIERWAAGLPLDDAVIAGMGVGGLLAEIEDRPRPRAKR